MAKQVITKKELSDILGLTNMQTLIDRHKKYIADSIDRLVAAREKYTDDSLRKKSNISSAYDTMNEVISALYRDRDLLNEIDKCIDLEDDIEMIVQDNLELINSENTKIIRRSSDCIRVEVILPQMPITKDGLTIPLGPYKMQVDIQKGYPLLTTILHAEKSDSFIGSNPHMAVKDGGLCYGDAARRADKLRQSKHIRPLLELASTVLSNYTTSGYRTLESYAVYYDIQGCRCTVCKKWINKGEGLQCSKCGYIVCETCATTTINKCPYCKQEKKDVQEEVICLHCESRPMHKCIVCGEEICSDHITKADIGQGWICPGCMWTCAKCGLTFDKSMITPLVMSTGEIVCDICHKAEQIAPVESEG